MRRLHFATALLLLLPICASASAAAPLAKPCTLLTDAQIAPAVGGRATHTETGTRLYRMCTWSGPAQGYSQTSQQLSLEVARVTKPQFLNEMRHTTPTPAPVPGAGPGTLAFVDNSGLYVWKTGYEIELDGAYLTVYPVRGVALAKLALKRL